MQGAGDYNSANVCYDSLGNPQFDIVKEGKGIPATVTNRQYSGREIHYSLKCGEDTFTVYAGSREQYEPGEQVKLVYQAS